MTRLLMPTSFHFRLLYCGDNLISKSHEFFVIRAASKSLCFTNCVTVMSKCYFQRWPRLTIDETEIFFTDSFVVWTFITVHHQVPLNYSKINQRLFTLTRSHIIIQKGTCKSEAFTESNTNAMVRTRDYLIDQADIW